MRARCWLVLSLVLGACDPDVLVVDGGSGGHGGGAGGSGGSPPVELRPLTLRVESALRSAPDLFATYPLEGLLVFANGADGSLLSSGVTDDDGLAELSVVDGGFVTAVSVDQAPCFLEKCKDNAVSIRVVPKTDSVRLPIEARDPPLREPMKLRVEWDLVEGALYKVRASCHVTDPSLPEGQSFLELTEYTSCPGFDEFAVVVEALLPGEPEYEPAVFGYVRDLEYVPGGELTVHVPLNTGTDAAALFVAGAEAANDTYSINHVRLLPGAGAGYCRQCGDRELVEGGVLATTLTAAFPELPAWSEAFLETDCTFTEFVQISQDFSNLVVPVVRLASPVPWAGDKTDESVTGGWKLLDGEVGDAVLLSVGWLDHDGDVLWRVLEPVLQQSEGVPSFELPPDFPKAVGPPPPGTAFTATALIDVVEAADFPTFLELYDSDAFHRQEATTWFCDPP